MSTKKTTPPNGAPGASAPPETTTYRINANPELKQAYETLVKNVPEDQREEVMTQLARQTQRTVARSQGQQQAKGETVAA